MHAYVHFLILEGQDTDDDGYDVATIMFIHGRQVFPGSS